jgi:glyoxylase-like metal-dependent hydrolase (beta-lactamase superfamily II)
MFGGDIVYVERLLAVLDISDSAAWIKSFQAMAAHEPLIVVPGHGHPADLLAAQAQTLDYLLHLREKIRAVLDAGGDIAEGTAVDQTAFAGMKNFDQLARRNAQAVFIEMEFD